jgi:hypothetical protein
MTHHDIAVRLGYLVVGLQVCMHSYHQKRKALIIECMALQIRVRKGNAWSISKGSAACMPALLITMERHARMYKSIETPL